MFPGLEDVMNTFPDRVQFRLTKSQSAIVRDIATKTNLSANIVAKKLFETGIAQKEIDAEKVAEDLLIIRAGVEEMFRRADRSDELSDAIERVRDRRARHLQDSLSEDAS